ncbi:MAG: hypothetical protein QOI48_2854 [Solirubrobacteraceae bacterium]|jgi:hypothetical protein|nr:hypothetical protein [Solirubrobacteraceae bacterium]
MSDTDTKTKSEPIPGEKVICLYPGCEREAVPPPKTAVEGRTGPPPRYCDIEEHNASTTYQELQRLENEAS